MLAALSLTEITFGKSDFTFSFSAGFSAGTVATATVSAFFATGAGLGFASGSLLSRIERDTMNSPRYYE